MEDSGTPEKQVQNPSNVLMAFAEAGFTQGPDSEMNGRKAEGLKYVVSALGSGLVEEGKMHGVDLNPTAIAWLTQALDDAVVPFRPDEVLMGVDVRLNAHVDSAKVLAIAAYLNSLKRAGF